MSVSVLPAARCDVSTSVAWLPGTAKRLGPTFVRLPSFADPVQRDADLLEVDDLAVLGERLDHAWRRDRIRAR